MFQSEALSLLQIESHIELKRKGKVGDEPVYSVRESKRQPGQNLIWERQHDSLAETETETTRDVAGWRVLEHHSGQVQQSQRERVPSSMLSNTFPLQH
jgi:hypothetical protein